MYSFFAEIQRDPIMQKCLMHAKYFVVFRITCICAFHSMRETHIAKASHKASLYLHNLRYVMNSSEQALNKIKYI